MTKEGKTLIPESYKCIILKNCEINKTGLKSVSDVLNNELGFQHNLSLGITYERSYIYSLNKSWNVEILDLLYNADEVAADQIVGRTTSATEDAAAAINQTEVEDNTQEPTAEPTPEPAQADYENYLIKKGDTLSEIVVKFKSKNPNLTVKMIQAANPAIIKNVNKIYAGDTIKIPLK
jgi:LysM repeat protein